MSATRSTLVLGLAGSAFPRLTSFETTVGATALAAGKQKSAALSWVPGRRVAVAIGIEGARFLRCVLHVHSVLPMSILCCTAAGRTHWWFGRQASVTIDGGLPVRATNEAQRRRQR